MADGIVGAVLCGHDGIIRDERPSVLPPRARSPGLFPSANSMPSAAAHSRRAKSSVARVHAATCDQTGAALNEPAKTRGKCSM